MKYNDIFSIDFIDLLNDRFATEKDTILIDPNEELESTYVNVRDILQKLGFQITEVNSPNISGELRNSKEILVNSGDVEYRKRFTMAHELGHALQGKEAAFRKSDSDGYSGVDKKDEIFANKFAAQLLMPRKLVVHYIDQYISENGLQPARLNETTVRDIKEYLSDKLNMSIQSINFRIENLNLFIEAEG